MDNSHQPMVRAMSDGNDVIALETGGFPPGKIVPSNGSQPHAPFSESIRRSAARVEWYRLFNQIEGTLWWLVAAVLIRRLGCGTVRQRMAVLFGSIGFVAFGITDWIEAGQRHGLPLWLWAMKIACGLTIFLARFTWRGWDRFRWNDREVRFGLGCLIAAVAILLAERAV